MKGKQFGKSALLGIALMTGLILGGCQNQQPKDLEVPMEEVPVLSEYEDYDDYEEPEETEEIEDTELEEYDDADEEEAFEEEETEPENQISFDEILESYDELLDVYNTVSDLYQSDDVPKDDGVEEILASASTEMDEIHSITEEDVPLDEDRLEVMKRIGELHESLSSLIDPLMEAAEENASYYASLAEYVQSNYDYMEQYFNTLWNYFSENGGTDSQIDDLVRARDAIGEIDDLSTTTVEELNEMNDQIDAVISLLEQLAASTNE